MPSPIFENLVCPQFDWDAIAEAVAHLGIERPVSILADDGLNGQGKYDWRNGEHVITVNRVAAGLGAGISATLWHELGHAADYDALGYWAAEWAMLTAYGAFISLHYHCDLRSDWLADYQRMPLEQRADRVMETAPWPLTR